MGPKKDEFNFEKKLPTSILSTNSADDPVHYDFQHGGNIRQLFKVILCATLKQSGLMRAITQNT